MVANVVDVFTRGEEKLVQPSRLHKGLSRSPARWILDISGVPARICGRLGFTAGQPAAGG